MRRGGAVAAGDREDPLPGTVTNVLGTLSGASLLNSEPSERLKALADISLEGLRIEWRRLYRCTPPARLSRDLLQRSIAHRLQEEVLGGLSTAAQRQLAAMARSLAANGKLAAPPAVRLKPGTTLVREWHGRTHTVFVLEKGFEHNGTHHASLTQIARSITGAHWSGPRFFGLRRRDRSAPAIIQGTDERG